MRELIIAESTITIHTNGLVYYADKHQMVCWENVKDAIQHIEKAPGNRWRAIETWLREQQEEK